MESGNAAGASQLELFTLPVMLIIIYLFFAKRQKKYL